MLSYRHGFHAGNPADVFKHTVLVALVQAMQHKDKGIRFIDTHAGPALYDLESEAALKNREFERGIGRLWAESPASGPRAEYQALVAAHNPDAALRFYPGSPLLLRSLLRPQDAINDIAIGLESGAIDNKTLYEAVNVPVNESVQEIAKHINR